MITCPLQLLGRSIATEIATVVRKGSQGTSFLVGFPSLNRLGAEPPDAAEANTRQTSLLEQSVDSHRMNAQKVRHVLDGQKLLESSRHARHRVCPSLF